MLVGKLKEEKEQGLNKSLNEYYRQYWHSLNLRWRNEKNPKERDRLYRLQIKIQEWESNLPGETVRKAG